MKFVVLLLLAGCTAYKTSSVSDLEQSKRNIEETNKILDQTNKKLECMIKIQHTDFTKEIDKECLKNLDCIRSYIEQFEKKCLEKQND